MNINGVDSNSVFQNITTNDIFDFGQSVDIKLTENTIDLIAPNILVNGGPLQPGGGGVVVNPLNADLNIGNVYDIVDNSGLSLRGINNNQISQASDILGLQIKTQNISSLDIDYTQITGNLTTTKLLVPEITDELGSSSIVLNTGGVNITSDTLNFNNNTVLSATGLNTQYFMGDGSLLQYSANSGNSNFYLYTSHSNTPGAPPDAGFVVYNNSNQSLATIIYISHITDDVIDIEVFFTNINQINDVYLQDKNNSSNFIKYNITGTPTITVGSHISIPVSVISSGGNGSTSFGINHPILLSFFTNTIEVDTRLSAVETKTQNMDSVLNQTGINGNLTVYGANGVIAQKFFMVGGISSEFLKANGTADGNTYAKGVLTQIVSSVPYINALGQVSSNISNLFVQQGNNTIASAVLAVQTGVGYSIQLSASSFTETLTLNKQNYILSGTDSPLFAPTTEIIGNTLIGSSTVGAASTRIKIKDIKFTGNLQFISSIYNELRTYISNCEITGTLIFPAVSGGGITWIYFFDCSIGGAITIPNQATYGIVFTRCNFAAQTITNSLSVGNTANLVYRECSGFLNLTLGNCIQYGMNSTYLGVSKSSAGSFVKDLGTSSMFLKGDGSTDSKLYSYRKFSLLSQVTLTGSQSNGNMMTGTFSPSLGYQFLANEAVIGDVYKLVVQGSVVNAVSMTFNIGFLNSTHNITSIATTAVTAAYLLEFTYTVRTSSVFGVNAICNVYQVNGINLAQFGFAGATQTSGNITNSSSLTLTYTNTGNGTANFSVGQMYLMKI